MFKRNDRAGGSRAKRTLVGVALLLGASVVVFACGGSSNSAGQQTTSNGGSQQVGVEEFGMTDEQLVTTIANTESQIAQCMQDAGFQYIPIDPVTFRAAMDSLKTAPGLSDDEFVAQYGYGISTLPPTQDFGAGPQNASVYDALSAADKVAYQRTLFGDHTDATFVVMLEQEDFEAAGGCTKTAIDQTFTKEQLSPSFVNPFDARVAQDPRMVAAVKEWSGCMNDAGYDYETQDDAEEELTDRFNNVTGGADPASLTGSDKDALTELQGEERAIAQADLDCAKRFLNDVEQQVERDISGRS